MEPGQDQEIMAALKEFEEKSKVEAQAGPAQAPTASFSETPAIVESTVKLSGGLIKSEKQAQYALLLLVVAMLGLSVYFFFFAGKKVVSNPNARNPNMMMPGQAIPGAPLPRP